MFLNLYRGDLFEGRYKDRQRVEAEQARIVNGFTAQLQRRKLRCYLSLIMGHTFSCSDGLGRRPHRSAKEGVNVEQSQSCGADCFGNFTPHRKSVLTRGAWHSVAVVYSG